MQHLAFFKGSLKSILSVTTINFLYLEQDQGHLPFLSASNWIPSNWTSNGAESMFLEDQTGVFVAFNKVILPGQIQVSKCRQCTVWTHSTCF